jgi:conjugal transfer pilus assembly protein TraL
MIVLARCGKNATPQRNRIFLHPTPCRPSPQSLPSFPVDDELAAVEPIELPRGLDDAHQILLASTDEMVPFFGMLIAGVLLEQLLTCLLLSVVIIKLFRRFRDNRPDGYLYHRLYWFGLMPLKGYGVLNPYRRLFLP